MDEEEIRRTAAEAQERLDRLAREPPRTMRFVPCGQCGAVVGVVPSEGGGFDNSEAHAGWHRRLEEYLAAHDETVKALAEFSEAAAKAIGGTTRTPPLVFEHSGIGVCNKGRRHASPCDFGDGV